MHGVSPAFRAHQSGVPTSNRLSAQHRRTSGQSVHFASLAGDFNPPFRPLPGTEKPFKLEDILSVVTDKNLNREGLDGFYQLIQHLMGEMTVSDELRSRLGASQFALKSLYPSLEKINGAEITRDNAEQWLQKQIECDSRING